MRELVVLVILVFLSPVHPLGINPDLPGALPGMNKLPGICGTQEVWESRIKDQKLAPSLSCATQGPCDTASVRAQAPAGLMDINLVFHVFQAANGTYPNGVNISVVNDQIAQIQQDYNNYNVLFNNVSVLFHKDADYYCIAPYGSNDWQSQVNEMKVTYAVNASNNLNIFISCQTSGTQGTLLGFGTFPWDKNALTSLGGVWMNSLATGKGMRTLTHELGHNLGLWHTFHGVSEMVGGCLNPCYEEYHSPTDQKANQVGDFCADTPATPINYNCAPPAGSDCYKVGWGETDYSNYMAYSGDPCMNHFTDQQVGRIHCWSCTALTPLMSQPCSQG